MRALLSRTPFLLVSLPKSRVAVPHAGSEFVGSVKTLPKVKCASTPNNGTKNFEILLLSATLCKSQENSVFGK